MSNLNFNTRWFLNGESVQDVIRSVTSEVSHRYSQTKFPPCNTKKTDNCYVIELAVAGYKKSDIQISTEDLQLIVKSDGVLRDSIDEDTQVIENGISYKAFERRWHLNEQMTVSSVVYENGILSITVIEEIPEIKKPKTYDIK